MFLFRDSSGALVKYYMDAQREGGRMTYRFYPFVGTLEDYLGVGTGVLLEAGPTRWRLPGDASEGSDDHLDQHL